MYIHVTIINKYLFFQYTTRWVDGTPIRVLDWVGDSLNDYSFLNRTIEQLQPRTKRLKLVASETISFHKTSIQSNMYEWCGALVFTTHGHPLGLIKIGCNMQMRASYFCQNSLSPIFSSPHIVGGPYHFINSSWQMYRCEEDWLQIEDTCFIMIELQGKLSWRKMNDMCEQRYQASLVKFRNTKDVPDFVISSTNTNDAIRGMQLMFEKLGIPPAQRNLDALRTFQSIHHLIGNRAISSKGTKIRPHDSKYKNMLALLKNVRWPVKTYVELLNKHGCYLLMESSSQNKFAIENIHCRQDNHITDVVCQRDWDVYMTCQGNCYTCADGTCILKEYRCDGNKDCYHGDDEINCTSIRYLANVTLNLLKKNKIRLFSVLCSTFDFLSRNDTNSDCLQHHTLCDNIQDISYERRHCENNKTLPTYYRKFKNNNSFMKVNNISFLQRCTFRTVESNSHVLHPFKREICDTIKCPFMFKCEHSYCIPIEKVCDGEIDCPYGADELSCENVSCPGMLKCRGEKRCLPDYLICNDIVDCLYSTDDELYCHSCPTECVCSGHSMFCIDIPPSQFASLYKTIVLKLNLSMVFDLSWTANATFLDLSFCHMTYYHFEHTSFSLLVLNFSYNDMTCLYMEAFHNFKYIHTIDFSHNAMSGLCSHPRPISDKTFKLSLIDIIISFNKLTVITSEDIKILSDLQYLDISSNPLHLVNKNIFRYLSSIDFLIVPIYGLCCLKHAHTQCVVEQVDVDLNNECQVKMGLFPQLIWTGFNILGLLLCILFLLYYCIHMRRGKCADSLFVNNMVNVILLFTFDSLHLNVSFYIYRFNMALHTLRVVGILAAQTSYIFSTMKDCTVILKIIFPFKHQCRPLRFLPWLCICVWISVIISGLLSTSDRNKSHRISLIDDGKYKFAGVSYKTNMVILLLLIVTSIILMLTCCAVLLWKNSSATRRGSVGRTNKLRLNIFSNLIFQSVLAGGGICILIVILFTEHNFKVDNLYLSVFYYISALRSFMVSACSVGIHAIYVLVKPKSWSSWKH